MEEEDKLKLDLINSTMKTAKDKLGEIQGSLDSMLGIETIVDEVSKNIKFKDEHTYHMNASNKVFLLHMIKLQTEQAQLIQLLITQGKHLKIMLDKMKPQGQDEESVEMQCDEGV
jgi:hypothetical protein